MKTTVENEWDECLKDLTYPVLQEIVTLARIEGMRKRGMLLGQVVGLVDGVLAQTGMSFEELVAETKVNLELKREQEKADLIAILGLPRPDGENC